MMAPPPTYPLVAIKKNHSQSSVRKFRLILTFYSSFAFISTIITIVCGWLTYKQGILFYSPLFWFKIFTIGVIVYFINGYKSNEFYYYRNLGLTKRFLWITTISFDFTMFLIIEALTIYFR